MPPNLLFDITNIDLTRVIYDQQAIRDAIPQRGNMEMLNGIVHADGPAGQIIGFKDVRPDEFWVAGHIPGRPLFPGVLMIETAAQLAAFYTRKFVGWDGFVGFGGVDEVRFRGQILPGMRLYVLALKLWARHRRVCCKSQGLVDGQLVFEATITGAAF